MPQEYITREELRDSIQQVAESVRREVASELTTTAVQIGAVEKVLAARIGGLKAWGVAALLGGQATAGLIAAIVTHTSPSAATRAAVGLLPFV